MMLIEVVEHRNEEHLDFPSHFNASYKTAVEELRLRPNSSKDSGVSMLDRKDRANLLIPGAAIVIPFLFVTHPLSDFSGP